jgi:hypothetical protein
LPHIQGFLPPDGRRSSFHISISLAVQCSSRKGECVDIHSQKKILENQSKGKWTEELWRAVWNHNASIYRTAKFTTFKLLYGEEPITLEEIKLRNARTKVEAIYNPTEAESKDLLELECMKLVDNLQSYQNETRAWRDKKVKLKSIEAGDLVLL